MQQTQLLKTQTAELPAVDAAKKLAGVIGESRVFQNYEKALQELRGNSEAQCLLTDFQQEQQSYQMRRSWDGATDDDDQQFRQKNEQVFDHPTLKTYFKAQEELIMTLKQIDALISEKLGIDFANSAKPAGGCC